MFTTNHFIWLGICAVIIAALLILSIKLKLAKKQAIGIMCLVSIASELCKIFTHIDPVNGHGWSDGGVISAGALPLHLCSIFVFVFFFLYFNKNEKIEEKIISFFVPIGSLGALLAILMATSGVNFAAPYAYQCFIYHSVMLWLSLFFIVTKQVKLGLHELITNIIVLLVLAILMIWINGALAVYDTNFFFVVRPPASGLPFLNLDHGWYVYFIHLACTGLILEGLFSLPYIIKEKKASN